MLDVVLIFYSLLTLVMLVMRLERGLLLLLPLIPLTGFTYRTPIAGLNTTNLLVFVSFGMAVLQSMRSGRRGVPPSTPALVAFFVVSIFGWVIGVLNFRSLGLDPIRSLKLVERWASYTLLYFSYFYGWSGRMPILKAFRWMFLGVLMDVIFNIVEFIHPFGYYARTGRTGGIFYQANSNGLFLASYCFIAIVLARLARSRLVRAFYLGSFGLSIVGIGLSLSRAAFSGFTANCLVYSFFRSKRWFAGMLLAVAIAVPTYRFVLPGLISERISMTFEGSKYRGELGRFEGSAANRVEQYIIGFKLFMDSPIIGNGIAGYYFRSPKYAPAWAAEQVRNAHSTIVMVAAEIGSLGLASLLWLFTSLFLTGKRLYDNGTSEGERLLGLFLITIMVGKLVANLFNTEFLTGDVSGYVWVTGGLLSWVNLQVTAPQAAAGDAPVRARWRPRVPRTVGHG